jgi:Virulence-associated protein E-like domain
MTDTTTETITAIEFLEKLRRGGPWVLTAINPNDARIQTITATDANAVAAFVHAHNGRSNLYYSVNPTRTAMTSKAKKADIAAIEYFLADLDPKDDETPEAAKARYLAALETHQPPCTAIVDSGNGLQLLWKLATPIQLDGDVAHIISDVEARVKANMEAMGSVAGTQNIDRILRLPGTTNLPNAKKLRDGRVACPATLIRFNGATCSLDDFPAVQNDDHDQHSVHPDHGHTLDWDAVAQHAGWLSGVAALPADFNAKGRTIVGHSGTIRDLNADLQQAKPYQSWSEVSFALTAIFKADGRYTPEQIAAALLCRLECNQHVTKHRDEAIRRRTVERLLNRSHEPTAQRALVRALNWRECYVNGRPKPSMHNARLAITMLGVACSYDSFHNKMLFGFRGESFRHAIGDEVSDNAIIGLRQVMSDRFGFDLEDKYTRDAVVSLALENCFDPVVDMLDKAEANWDGIERLDAMAVEYFNCEDTPLNRAFVRKTMIAAVRRARHPGCKFDNITILESKEGWNKSSAWRVLAGDENFSDQSILGVREKEVQEQLATIWIHESADLAGMRKAEVETIKAFASRQEDIARPAYGHFVKKQKRHSINVGTTNSHEYLQSQTGNRRFWPLEVLSSIDIEKLRRDRLQLWGEAAKYERAGESLVIDAALWDAAGAAQERRRVRDPWEERITNLPANVTYINPVTEENEPKQIIFHQDEKEVELVPVV